MRWTKIIPVLKIWNIRYDIKILIWRNLLESSYFGMSIYTSLISLTAPIFSHAIQVGVVTDHNIDEASGLAASRIHPSVLYTHNDKGDSSRIFAIDADSGNLLAALNINNARNYDWEDIAIGGCPGALTKSCIYIGNPEGFIRPGMLLVHVFYEVCGVYCKLRHGALIHVTGYLLLSRADEGV